MDEERLHKIEREIRGAIFGLVLSAHDPYIKRQGGLKDILQKNHQCLKLALNLIEEEKNEKK